MAQSSRTAAASAGDEAHMEHNASMEAVAGVIQLSVAPVFLLAGIAGLLAMLSARLGRVTDRARIVERRIPTAQSMEQEQFLYAEAGALWRRIRIINWAIRLCVSSALTVCLVIVALFVGDFAGFNISIAVAALFVTAMLFIISGLILLLREVGIATGRMRLGMEMTLEGWSPERASARKAPAAEPRSPPD